MDRFREQPALWIVGIFLYLRTQRFICNDFHGIYPTSNLAPRRFDGVPVQTGMGTSRGGAVQPQQRCFVHSEYALISTMKKL